MLFAAVHESAFGPKRTCTAALHMSAFGGKADVTICGMSAFAVAIGGKADMACCQRICLLLTQSGHECGRFTSDGTLAYWAIVTT
jgi:hypothetical protein